MMILFSKNRFEEDIKVIKNNPGARVIFCKIASINENGKLIKEINYPINKITNSREVLLLKGVHMCAMTIHKYCFNEIGFFDEKNRTTQDVQMTLLLSSRFPFYLNTKSTTYIRGHIEQGTQTLSQQHKKDLLYLCDFMHEKLSIDDFFPAIKNNQNEISDALVWMGFQYYYWGPSKYAGECFHKSIYYEKNISKKFVIILKITHRITTWKIGKFLKEILPSPLYLSLMNNRRKLMKIVRNQ